MSDDTTTGEPDATDATDTPVGESTDAVAEDPAGTDAAVKPSKHRGRRITTVILIILGCVLAPIALVGVWAKTTVLDTDGYVDTVAPLATNQEVIDLAATRISEGFVSATDIQDRLTEALPPRAAKAAPAMSAAVENVVYNGAQSLLESDQFATIWDNANRRAHTQVMTALTGKDEGRVKLVDDQVTLNLTPVANKVRAKVESLGLDVNITDQRRFDPKIVLFDASFLKPVQFGVKALDTFAWVTPLLVLVLLGAGIATSVHRRKTVLHTGLGIALGAAVVLIALNLGRGPYLDLFKADGRAAGGAVYDQILGGLRLGARGLFVLGIVVAIGAWLAGPGAGATRLRATVTGHARDSEPGAFATWVGRNRTVLRVVIIALGLAVLVAASTLTGLLVIGVFVVVLVLIALVEFIGRSGPSAVEGSDGASADGGDATEGETAGETEGETETADSAS